MLVRLGGDFEVLEIWEAGRKEIIIELDKPGSKTA